MQKYLHDVSNKSYLAHYYCSQALLARCEGQLVKHWPRFAALLCKFEVKPFCPRKNVQHCKNMQFENKGFRIPCKQNPRGQQEQVAWFPARWWWCLPPRWRRPSARPTTRSGGTCWRRQELNGVLSRIHPRILERHQYIYHYPYSTHTVREKYGLREKKYPSLKLLFLVPRDPNASFRSKFKIPYVAKILTEIFIVKNQTLLAKTSFYRGKITFLTITFKKLRRGF